MTSFNMPPGVNVSDIPGYNDPDYIYPDVRCDVCGCFIACSWSERQKNFIRQEIHEKTYHCKGGFRASCDDWAACSKEHDWTEYDGMTAWYRCSYCGTEVPNRDF